MRLFRQVLLFCGWLWFFCKQGISSVYHQPLVREGDSYSMVCTGNLSLAEWDIEWLINNSKPVTRCTLKNGCINLGKGRFQVVMKKTENPLTSVLTIHNMSWEERRWTFHCKAFEEKGTRLMTLGIWNISRSYLPPDRPLACESNVQAGQVIHLSCTAHKVYPDISCQPVQICNGKETLLKTSVYYNKTSFSHEYYSASCSAVISPYVPGVYKFCVNSTTAGQPNNYSCTNNTVIITNQTTVRIAYDVNTGDYDVNTGDYDVNTVKICQGDDNFMIIRCEILWWQSPETPITSCYVDDEVITNYTNVVAINRTERQYSSYEWFCSFILSLKHNEKSVTCLVTAENVTHSAAAKLRVSSYPPSKPPQFVYKDYMNSSRTVFSLAKNINVSVECTMEGCEHTTSLVTVECSDVFFAEKYTLTRQNKAELSFIFHGDTDCTCTVKHASSKCAVSPVAKLIFVKEHHKSSWYCWSFYCLEYFMIAVLVGFGVLCVFILKWRARRKHSKTSDYDSFRKKQLRKSTGSRRDDVSVAKSEETAYAIVDIVSPNSDIPGISHLSHHSYPSKQYQNSTSLQNCHLLSRRQQQPLTVISPQHRTEKTDNDKSSFNFQHNGIGVRESMNSNNIRTVVSDYKSLSREQLPPLPPRLNLGTKHRFPETSLHERDSLFNVKTTTPVCLPNKDTIDRDAACHTYSNNLQSLPRRPPPPVPCGLESKAMSDIDVGLAARDSTSRNDICYENSGINVTADIVEPVSSVRLYALQQNWPPPPFKTRKQTGKKNRNVNRKYKERRHEAIGMISPNPNELLKATCDTRLDDMINTYINIKAEPLCAQQNISETLITDYCCNSIDGGSNLSHRKDDSDVCSSQSCYGRSTSCSSTSTSEVTDHSSSDAESALL